MDRFRTGESVFISVVTLGEIRKGCELLDIGRRREGLEEWLEMEVRAWFAGRILPVTESIAERWGRLEARRQRLGQPLNTADGQIAATALEHGLTLATRNVNDFRDLGVTLSIRGTRKAQKVPLNVVSALRRTYQNRILNNRRTVASSQKKLPEVVGKK